MSYDEHTILLGKFSIFFVNLPDKRISFPLSVLSESYEVNAMKSISVGVSGFLDFNAL